jgi:hypothetical protein
MIKNNFNFREQGGEEGGEGGVRGGAKKKEE